MPQDCPLAYRAVPGSTVISAPCSGRGTPVHALGTCLCYAGYEGAACEACADGYAPAGGLCQRTQGSFQVAAALAGRNATVPAAPSAAAKVRPLAA